ncbi:MAG: PAS domain S-box protein [Chloroflexi bacterium]|nr:PAS domain S-box protein [Chloroflexota bacterium]
MSTLPVSLRHPILSTRPEIKTLRWLIPIVAFVTVVAVELIHNVIYNQPFGAFPFQLIAYAVVGPMLIGILLHLVYLQMEEQSRRLEEVRAREQYMATVSATVADAIIGIDMQGNIQLWNRGAEMMFGWRADEIAGRHFNVIVPPDRVDEFAEIEKRTSEHGFLRGFETMRVAKDGARIPVELTRTTIRDPQGRPLGTAAVLRDISERVRAENAIRQLNHELEDKVRQRTRELQEAYSALADQNEELRQANDKLQSLDRLKNEFVSMVSHELRAPLTNINGSLELMRADCDQHNPTCRQAFTIVNDQTDRLGRLIKGVLNVARIEAGALFLQSSAFDMTEVMDHVIATVRARAGSYRFRRVAETPLHPAWGDRDRINEVLLNLLDNAVKYSDEGSLITLQAYQRGAEVVVTVTDQGQGIPPEEKDRIFEKFYRVDGSDAQQIYGHGLGLYISRKMIEAMRGRMWVESELGRGSTFSYTVPIAATPAAEGEGVQ